MNACSDLYLNSRKQEPKRILMVEDEEPVAHLMQIRIEQMGGLYTVDLAQTVEDARFLFAPLKYFAVLLDLKLDGSIENGIELAVSFREQDDNVFIAVVSGYYPVFDARLIEAIDDYIQKPLTPDLLQAKLFMWTSRYRRRQFQKFYVNYTIDEKVASYLTAIAEIKIMETQIQQQLERIAEHIGFTLSQEKTVNGN